MKTIIRISLIILTIQFASCEKDSGTITKYPTNTVSEYRNGKMFRKYVYKRNYLLAFHEYDYNGVLSDTMEFFYTSDRLDSTYSHSLSTGEKYLTAYNYHPSGILKSFHKQYSHNYSKDFTIYYFSNRDIYFIRATSTAQPFEESIYLDRFGNVYNEHSSYVSSLFNENFQTNRFAYNSEVNFFKPFWIIDPIEFFPTNNLVTAKSQYIRSTNDGNSNPNAVWHTQENNWTYHYTYDADGNVSTKTVLDSASTILDEYRYEYMTN